MKIVTDSNREEIVDEYINGLLDTMDWDDLYQLAYDYLYDSKDLLTNEALELEIKDYRPELLEAEDD